MGMAASQARYLALTGRMNDIEYQGQQINQQRTTLSTQINELYNSLLDMSVPTPPSQTDFSKTVYSGTLGATKFTMGTVRPTGNDNYNIDLKFSMSGDAVTKTNRSKTLIKNTETLNYADASKEALSKVFYSEDVTTYTQSTAVTAVPEGTDSDNKDIMIATNYGAVKDLKDVILAGSDKKSIADTSTLNDDSPVYVIAKMKDIKAGGKYEKLLTKNEGETSGINNVYEYTSVTETVIGDPKVGFGVSDKYANDKVEALGYYTYEGEPGKDTEPILITTVARLKEELQKNPPKIVKQSGTGDIPLHNEVYQTGDCDYLVKNGSNVTPLYSLNTNEKGESIGRDKISDCGVDISNVIAGLRHSFNISENEMDDDQLLSLFSVYVVKSESGEETPYFIQNKDYESVIDGKYTNIPSYEYNASGTYTNAKPTDNCKLEFDATGRITRVGIPNDSGDYDWVELTVSTEVDQMAYEEAMKDYNYEKIVYDKRQEEINLKTSIVQQQDKNLELKLTRLDNERTALNTELEAVKKVVNDNIDKTYKTFNG